MKLTQKYEERVPKLSFLTQNYFKSEFKYLYCYLTKAFVSIMLDPILICFQIVKALLATRTFNIKS